MNDDGNSPPSFFDPQDCRISIDSDKEVSTSKNLSCLGVDLTTNSEDRCVIFIVMVWAIDIIRFTTVVLSLALAIYPKVSEVAY